VSDTPASPVAPPAAGQPLELTPGQVLYVWLAGAMTASLLLADVLGVRLFDIALASAPLVEGFPLLDGHLKHTCGMLTFPLTFLITDLVNDYYGRLAARRLTWLALGMGFLAFLTINLALVLPRLEADFNVPEAAFEAVFKSSRWMYVASLAAYTVGQMLDIVLFGVFKRLTGGRMIWLRATGSTVVSQMFDSLVVSTLYFGAVLGAPPLEVLKLAATGYVLKFFLALSVTPLIYAGHAVIERWFGLLPLPVEES
jgi:hypothetical protein